MAGSESVPDDHTVLTAAFDAVGSDAAWPAFLDIWAKRFRSGLAQIAAVTLTPEPQSVFGLFSGQIEQTHIDTYLSRYMPRDAAIHLQFGRPGRAFHASSIAPPGASAIEAIEFFRGRDAYHEFFRPLGIDWVLGLLTEPVMRREGPPVGLSLGLARSLKAGNFTADECVSMERLAPLVRRAIGLHLRFAELEARSAEASGAADRVADGVVFVDGNAVVRHANPVAERILAAGDGLAIHRGRLNADRNDDRTRLHRAIFAAAGFAKAEGGPGDDLLLARPSGKRAYRVTVAPSPRREIGFGLIAAGRVVVTINDPEAAPAMPAAELRRVFGLTPGEVEIALALARGETVAAYADRRGVSINTVRTLLKRAMAKTGSIRQSQLVAIVLGRMPDGNGDGR